MSISEMRNTTTGKVVGFLAALTLVASVVFGASYAPAQAQTEAELKAQIAELTALIAELTAQLGGSVDSGDFSYVFTRDLSLGSTGEDVMKLQQYLNMNAATQVAAVGAAGGPGTETSYYGPATAAAVSKYQQLHAASILTPLGLTSGTGYFGASTRAHMNAAIASGDTDGDDDDDNGSGSGDLEGVEAVIKNFDFDNEGNAAEGESEAEVAVITYDVEAGDVELNRLDLVVAIPDAGGLDETRPWRIFDEIVLLDGEGDEIASVDAGDRDMWSKEQGITGHAVVYSTRITGLDYVTRRGDEGQIVVAASLNGSVNGAGTANNDVGLLVPQNGLRFVDAAGLVQYAPSTATSPEVFEVLAEGHADELTVRTNSDNPGVSSLRVEETDESEEHTVLVTTFRVGDNDVLVDGVTVTVATGTENYEDVVEEAFIVIDGEEFDNPTVTNGASTTATLAFDTEELELDGDEDYDVEVVLVFQGATGNYTAGSETVLATMTAVTAEGLDSQATITVSGLPKAGNLHTLRTTTASVSGVSSVGETIGTTTKPGYLRFTFTVTADDGDLSFSMADVEETLSGTDVANAVSTGTLTKIGGTATDSTSPFDILEGETAKFSLEYVVTPVDAGDNGTYYATLDSVLGVSVNETASVTVSF